MKKGVLTHQNGKGRELLTPSKKIYVLYGTWQKGGHTPKWICRVKLDHFDLRPLDQSGLVSVSLLHYDLWMKCDPPVMEKRGSHPKKKLIAKPGTLASHYDFGIGCDPPFPSSLYHRVKGVRSHYEIIVKTQTAWTRHQNLTLWFRNGVWPPPSERKKSHPKMKSESKCSMLGPIVLTRTMISEWGVTPFWTIHGTWASKPYMGFWSIKRLPMKNVGFCFWIFLNHTWSLGEPMHKSYPPNNNKNNQGC